MNELFENWSEVKEELLTDLPAAKKLIVALKLDQVKNSIFAETASQGAIAANEVAGFRAILIPMIRRIAKDMK